MTPLQKRLLEIITSIDAICQRNNITYYLGGGTALGAVRHGGFLPWDDDADLYITRDNWLRLKDKLQEELPEHLTLVTTELFPNYRNPLCRVVDENSTMFYNSRIADETPHGVQVEFFILDPVPNDAVLKQRYFKNLWLYVELLVTNFTLANDRLPEEVTDTKAYVRNRIKGKLIGDKKILSRLEQELFNYKEEECSTFCLRWGQRQIVYKKEIFQKARYVQFEDLKLPVATRVEDQLRTDYGDTWVNVPSVDDQIVHTSMGNIDKSYKEHMDYIYAQVNLPKMRKDLLRRKTRNVLKYKHRVVVDKETAFLQKIEAELRLQAILAEYDQLEQDLLQQNFTAITNTFSEYISLQISTLFIRRNIFISSDDDTIYTILYSLTMLGRYYDAEKILKIRNSHRQTKCERLEDLSKLIATIRKIVVSRYDNTLSEVEDDIAAFLADYPQQNDVQKADIVAQIRKKEYDFLQLEQRIKDACEMYSGDGELLSFLADLYYLEGQFEQAAELYGKAWASTTNGIVLLNIKEKMQELQKLSADWQG